MNKNKRELRENTVSYILLIMVAVIMLYPLIWMVFASFKDNQEIFQSSLIPSHWTVSGYVNGWKGSGQYTYATFFKNTFLMVLPMVFFTMISASFVAFGFARFQFFGKKSVLCHHDGLHDASQCSHDHSALYHV